MTKHGARVRHIETMMAGLALAAALFINHRVGMHLMSMAHRLPTTEVDFLLGILPRLDATAVYVWGFAAFLVYLVCAGVIHERHRTPYILWMYALLVILRACFLILTPLNAPPGAFHADEDPLFDLVGKFLTFRNDLFFSAHTSLPFLGYLIYRNPVDRAILLLFSVVLAVSVLLCRLHYSVDVVAAYFITYALVRAHRRWVEPRYKRWRIWVARAVSSLLPTTGAC